ncbi:MAG: hypothetical protein WC998_00505 [Candidatus Paceibacterota bacterium]|jgi:hypothetical protein
MFKKKNSGRDWSTRPCQIETTELAAVPEPIGGWPKNSTVYFYVDDVNCYGSSSEEKLLLWATTNVKSTIAEIISYMKDRGLKLEQSYIGNGVQVNIKFYYQPFTKAIANIESLSKGYESLKGCDSDFIVNSKKISGLVPGQGTNYNGLVQAQEINRVMKSADCWINLYTLQLALQASEAAALQIFKRLFWHEAGHWACGLRDDVKGKRPGIMVYSYLSLPPSKSEELTIDWLYN